MKDWRQWWAHVTKFEFGDEMTERMSEGKEVRICQRLRYGVDHGPKPRIANGMDVLWARTVPCRMILGRTGEIPDNAAA